MLKEIGYSTRHHLKLEPHVEHYLDVYEKYFEPIQNNKIKFLEIGVDQGGSLAIWQEYFPNGEIHGIDIEDKRLTKAGHFHLGNQTDKAFLEKLNSDYGPFDIILDDGGHKTSQQTTSLEILFPLLNSGGLYIIEDLHTSYWTDFIDTQENTVTQLCYLVNILNQVHTTRNTCWTPAEYLIARKEIPTILDFIHFYDSICVIKKHAS